MDISYNSYLLYIYIYEKRSVSIGIYIFILQCYLYNAYKDINLWIVNVRGFTNSNIFYSITDI